MANGFSLSKGPVQSQIQQPELGAGFESLTDLIRQQQQQRQQRKSSLLGILGSLIGSPQSLGQGIGGVLGAGVGGRFGGPVGARFGGELGSRAGGQLGSKLGSFLGGGGSSSGG